VSDFRERVSDGARFFDETVYIKAGEELVALEQAHREASLSEAGIHEVPTFFELITLFFFLCARRAGSDIMVVETGMGGRLDATNIVTPLVSVITLIELEHTETLGTTLAAIAGEKAGIIKEGRPLLLARQPDEALAVFKARAADKHAPLYYFPAVADVADIRISNVGTSFTLRSPLLGPPDASLQLSVSIPGAVQAYNAGLAVLALKTAFPALSETGCLTPELRSALSVNGCLTPALRSALSANGCLTPELRSRAICVGLQSFSLPARFERLTDTPLPFIIDGAHTPRSIASCVETFALLYGNAGLLIFGCIEGKDIRSMARALIPHFSRVIITTPGSFKKSNPDAVHAIFQEECAVSTHKPSVLYIPDTAAAIAQARSLMREERLAVLGTGSFYLAAAIRAHI
jgi:dihydrofolate synthase/folylpolyglutamate synthase